MSLIFLNLSIAILFIAYSFFLVFKFGKNFKFKILLMYKFFLLSFFIMYVAFLIAEILNYLSGRWWLLASILLFLGALFVLFATWTMIKIYRVQKKLTDDLKNAVEINRITGRKNENAIDKDSLLFKGAAVYVVSLQDVESIKVLFGQESYEALIVNATNILSDVCHNFGAKHFQRTDAEWIVISCTMNGWRLNGIAEELYKRLSAPISIGHEFVRKNIYVGQYITQQKEETTGNCIKNALAAMSYGLIHHEFITNYDKDVVNHLSCSVFVTQASRDALNCDLFTIEFQPIVDRDSNLFAIEALLRLKLRSGEVVSPMVFIPILENSEIILDVTKMVIKEIAGILENSQFKGYVNVNLSARCLESKVFLSFCEKIKENHVDCVGRIVFEITESAIANDSKLAIESIWELHRLGYKISIDDFGVGYTSLRKISELPIFQIKIDKFFTSGIYFADKKRSIVKSLVLLANEINAHIVTEGVEDNETYEVLKSIGPHYFQGYLFARPTSFERAISFSL